jgi:hypothetical protein
MKITAMLEVRDEQGMVIAVRYFREDGTYADHGDMQALKSAIELFRGKPLPDEA